MRGWILVNIGYFLLIFVNVVPVAITKHGTQHSGRPSHNGKNHGQNNHEHKQHKSDEQTDNEKIQKHNRNNHNSAHHNLGHHNPSHLQNHQNSGKENHQNINKVECKCDNILKCECDSAVAEPSAIGNFSCRCADEKSLYSKGNDINCNCLKAHISTKQLECQCIQNDGSTLNKTIDCPEANGYFIETNEHLIDFSGTNYTVHIYDKSKQDGQMRIHEHLIDENLGTTIPTVPEFPDDINPFPTTSSAKPVITTTKKDMDLDFQTTTPIPKVPEPPNDNGNPTGPLITTTSETPNEQTHSVGHTVSPTRIPEIATEISEFSTEMTPPLEQETTEPIEPPTEIPELPTTEETEPPPEETEPPTVEPPIAESSSSIVTPAPPTEIPIPSTYYTPSNGTTSESPPSPKETPPELPKPAETESPKIPEVNWGRIKDDYYFWTMIIEIKWTEFKYIYEIYVEHFEDESFDLCNGTYVGGQVTCNSDENTDQCTKENRCNCICVGEKLGKKEMEYCFCNRHVLQPVVKYPASANLKECGCYNPANKGNSLICDCIKLHSADKIEPLVLTELHTIDISIIVRYLVQFAFEGDINICQCIFYNGEGYCHCKADTEYYTKENTADCLCVYKFQNENLIGHCYCADGIKDKAIKVKYDKNIFIVQWCICYNSLNEGTSFNCLCEDYTKPTLQNMHDVQIDLRQFQQINLHIILNYFLQIYELRYEHFEVCTCKINNGKTFCRCENPIQHCTGNTPCSCFSVYQYQQENWHRMLFCNPNSFQLKFKFNEQTTEIDNCTCHHSDIHELICKCNTTFSIDSSKQIVDFNNVVLDLTKNQVINQDILLNAFSQIREYHNETFQLCSCAYGSNDFKCLSRNTGFCNPVCKCLCTAYVQNDTLGSDCICNSHVEETKIDYNPAVFDLEEFTCKTPMLFYLSCDYKRKEAVNYEFTNKSIIDIYLETQSGQTYVNRTIIKPGWSAQIVYTNSTVEGGKGIPSGQVYRMNFSSPEEMEEFIKSHGGGNTVVTHTQSGPVQGSATGWQSEPIPAGSTTSQQTQTMKFSSVEEMQKFMKSHGGGKTVITQTQSGPVQGSATGWQSKPIPAGSTTSQQTQTMKFSSVEEMQKFLKSHGGNDGSYKIKEYVQKIPAN